MAHVLVIDDDRELAEFEARLLAGKGHRVVTAGDGVEALLCIEREMPDVILLDMRMPVMDGRAFAREYHARYRARAPIVVTTASEDPERCALAIGAEAWLAKPFGFHDLLEAVDLMASPSSVWEESAKGRAISVVQRSGS